MTQSADAHSEVSVDEALRIALEMHRDRRLDGAEDLYRRILAVAPDHPDALHFLGVVRHDLGKGEEAVALIRRAIEIQPRFPGFHNNLGNIHAERGELAEATAAYERAIALAPDAADLHNNLGALYRIQERPEEALAAYHRALALDPNHVGAHSNIALLRAGQGRYDEAVRWYCKALELDPGNPGNRRQLGYVYCVLNQTDKATEVFREWMEAEPENPVPRHMYAACQGKEIPARASDDYVERVFDSFASGFESQLNERLQYRAPQLCRALLDRVLPPPARQFAMLDAGCGTGLCGPLMAPWARTLTGVDLSSGMLARAQTKGVYDQLPKAELTDFLRTSPGAFDVVVCADTLCYFGDLTEFGKTCKAAMRADGILIFTVEAIPESVDAPFRLRPHGRYEHARRHVEEVLAGSGFAVIELGAEVLRTEVNQPVHGWVVAARALETSAN